MSRINDPSLSLWRHGPDKCAFIGQKARNLIPPRSARLICSAAPGPRQDRPSGRALGRCPGPELITVTVTRHYIRFPERINPSGYLLLPIAASLPDHAPGFIMSRSQPRPLLPASPPPLLSESSADNSSILSGTTRLGPARVLVAAACKECRIKKAKVAPVLLARKRHAYMYWRHPLNIELDSATHSGRRVLVALNGASSVPTRPRPARVGPRL